MSADFSNEDLDAAVGAGVLTPETASGLRDFVERRRTATIADLQDAMAKGALTSEKLTELYLARIAAYDKQGPKLAAFLYLNPRALDEARALDAERAAKGPRGPLHGIPIVLKDVFDTVDMPTTGGWLPLKGVKPTKDSLIAKKLREAGVIIIGKTNQSDWYGQPPNVAASTLGGNTLNPYDLTRTPGWSSSGTSAATLVHYGCPNQVVKPLGR